MSREFESNDFSVLSIIIGSAIIMLGFYVAVKYIAADPNKDCPAVCELNQQKYVGWKQVSFYKAECICVPK